ncbi:hypothetical protein KEM56_001845 [Ascosphaera pollenicola]|nr:hypothetical protein KEM56_001845 [Ascosphaera pollenicola]
MYPPVTSLCQSQHVLKALQRFGEVTTFLNTKYNATNIRTAKSKNAGYSAVVIFENAQAASAAKAASPLTVPIGASSARISGNGNGNGATEETATIKVSIAESTHMHGETILHNPFYSAFPVSTDSIEVQDLIRSNSNYHSAPSPAFADCFTARKRSMPTRLVKIVERNNNAKGATSLMNVWKSGKEARGESIDDAIESPAPSPSLKPGVQGTEGGLFHRRSAAGRLREEEERAKLQTLGFQVPVNRKEPEGL